MHSPVLAIALGFFIIFLPARIESRARRTRSQAFAALCAEKEAIEARYAEERDLQRAAAREDRERMQARFLLPRFECTPTKNKIE